MLDTLKLLNDRSYDPYSIFPNSSASKSDSESPIDGVAKKLLVKYLFAENDITFLTDTAAKICFGFMDKVSKSNQKSLLKELILSAYYHKDNLKRHLVDCVFLMLYSPCVWAYNELEWKENTFTFYQFQKVGAGLLNMLNGGKYTDGYCAYEEKVYGDKSEYVRKRVVLSILVFLEHLNELQVLEQSVEYYINWFKTNGFEWINPRNHDKTLYMHSFFDTYLPEEILSLKGKRLGYLYANISLFEE